MFQPCENCSGEIIVGQYEPITVPRVDEDGFPLSFVEGGQLRLQTITINLPAHRANTYFARSTFDPTGMAPALCVHGAPEHPAGLKHPFAVSWIRAKYLETTPSRHCPVCRGEPRPDDMTTPRVIA